MPLHSYPAMLILTILWAPGTSLLAAQPPACLAGNPLPRSPIHLTIVLDASRSMSGEKWALAQECVADLLESLTGHDRFAVRLFAGADKDLFNGSIEATPAGKALCAQLLHNQPGGGGIELPGVMRSLLARDGSASESRVIIIISDGRIWGIEETRRLLDGRDFDPTLHISAISIGTMQCRGRSLAGLSTVPHPCGTPNRLCNTEPSSCTAGCSSDPRLTLLTTVALPSAHTVYAPSGEFRRRDTARLTAGNCQR